MEKERIKKIEAGRERLAAYKKKKKMKVKCTSEDTTASQSSDSSLSLCLPDLPDNASNKELVDQEPVSDTSTISEHLQSSSGSVEHDRSFQEIEVSNSPLILQNFPPDIEFDHISRKNKLPSLNISYKCDSFNVSDISNEKTPINISNVSRKCSDATINVQSILNEILRNEQFKSNSDYLGDKSDTLDTNDLSFNIFEGISLDDSSVNNYASKLRQSTSFNIEDSLNEKNLFAGNFNDLTKEDNSINADGHFCSEDNVTVTKIKSLEEQLAHKDNTIAALTAELDSYKEMTSNQSTLSINTTTTEYKQFQEEYHNKIVEFQNAITHRDALIQQLTESLQQSILNKEELHQQSEKFAREISLLQKQLTETSSVIKQHRCSSSQIQNDRVSTLNDITLNSWKKHCTEAEEIKNMDKSDSEGSHENNENKEYFAQYAQTQIAQKTNTDLILNLENECSKVEDTLSVGQLSLMNDLKIKINMYIQQKITHFKNLNEIELKILKDKLECEKVEHEIEVGRLRELLTSVKCGSSELMELRNELDAKHAQEMEELRKYFEKKCADLEKHYSEEVFSQQSRKMSGSSSCSEAELSSDIVNTGKHPQLGPGGDTVVDHNRFNKDITNLSKKNLHKLKKDTLGISNLLNKVDIDNLSKDNLCKLKLELTEYNLHSLVKCDFSNIKCDMQNKYHAELEILREDYENRIDLLIVDSENKLRNMKEMYQEQIDALKYELNEAVRSAQMNISTAVQEVASSGEYELAEVVQSYERRLQEQVTLARIDIISALEREIQILATNENDSAWPTELLQIHDRFAEKYEVQITELKEKHNQEIIHLKEEHNKKLNGALERARRRSLRDSDTVNQNDLEIIKDRDLLKKSNWALRHLLGELLKYFTQCEDELNNTLVDEIIKQGFDKNLTQIEGELNLNESLHSNSSKMSDSSVNVTKRVHFTPNFSDFMNIVNNSELTSWDSKDLSLDLKNELGTCLERLRSDAHAILVLSTNIQQTQIQLETTSKNTTQDRNASLEEKITSLTRQLITDSQIKNDLGVQLNEAKNSVHNLEFERVSLENQVEELITKQKLLETEIRIANKKIADLVECGHKEIVSEGYGQNHGSLDIKNGNLPELQERARVLVTDWKNGADHPLIQLVDELCRECERITDEAKKDHEDLRQQIDAADKKLRATCHFLEEQAADREQERDEAQKQISLLHEQLKEREKDRSMCELVCKEVEQLEQQMREMTKSMEISEQKQQEVENEKKDAVEKIWVLRDIIRDLESQIELKVQGEVDLKNIIGELEDVINQQTKANNDLNQRLESYKNIPGVHQLKEQIVFLENEIQQLRLTSELVGKEGPLKELQLQLNEFETCIEKRTRDLEGIHSAISTTSCSSPSEDMSIRDQIRPRTPSTMLEECDVPLQQLARLKEKLVKHSRAEDAALKRIRDIEMQLDNAKHDLEDTQNEKEILQDQVSEQLILISSLQMRLDEQRLRAEQVQKQANTSLEVRIYDLENDLQSLKETVHNRDKTIKQLNKVIDQTKKRLEDRENELISHAEDNIILNLRQEIEHIRQENDLLKVKIDSDAQNAQILPGLVDNIIADKNADIEKLRDTLSDTQKQLEIYSSLNLNHEQLKQLSKLSSNCSLGDILTLLDFDALDPMRKIESRVESLNNSVNLEYKRNPNETVMVGGKSDLKLHFQPEISTIEKVGHSNINFTVDAPLVKPNSTEIHRSLEKHVHFEDINFNTNIENDENPITQLKMQILEKDKTITDLNERLKMLIDLESNIDSLQKKLETTEGILNKTTKLFQKEKDEFVETEKILRIELAEKKMHLTEKEKQLELSEQDNGRKDQMYMNLAQEKRELELKLHDLKENTTCNKQFDEIISEKNENIDYLEQQLAKLIENGVLVEQLETTLKIKNSEITDLKTKYTNLEEKVAEKVKELDNVKNKCTEQENSITKLEKELYNKSMLSTEFSDIKLTIEEKNKQLEEINNILQEERNRFSNGLNGEIQKLKNMLVDRECEIDILNEDITRYHSEIDKLEEKIKENKRLGDNEAQLQLMKNKKEIAQKDLEIIKLKTMQEDMNKELIHLQDYLNEKDRVIEQMKNDTKSLHINLETIQNKIQETGNIVDLRRRLQEEQHVNAVLQEEINTLKVAISDQNERKERSLSIEEITGQVQKELDYSAHLDSNILQALSSGDEFNLPANENFKETLTRERMQNIELARIKTETHLEIDNLRQRLNEEKENVRQLQILLEKEKHTSESIQIEDANLIEQMRIQLETAINNENEFQKMLDSEKKLRQDIEFQFNTLKQKTTNLSTSSNSKTELTEYKSLPNMETQEIIQLRLNVSRLTDENSKLKADIKLLKRCKSEQDANLKYIKDMVHLKSNALEKLEFRIDEIRKNEMELKEKIIHYKAELDQKNREIENSRLLMGELEQERLEMKKEIMALSEKLRVLAEEKRLAEVTQEEKDVNMSSTIPEKFLNKMKELGNLVKEHINENKIITDTLSKLTNERTVLQERIRTLEEQNNYKMPFDDPVARADHLFGRYLRSESYRKALIWQKRYLIALLATYQNFGPISERLPLANFQPKTNKTGRSKGKNRFKCAVTGIIALIRMRYLVQRWHSGKRIGAHVHFTYYKNAGQNIPENNNNANGHSTQFQLGQPVSSQNFSSNIRRIGADVRFSNSNTNLRTTSRDLDPIIHDINSEVSGTSKKIRNVLEERPVTPQNIERLPPWSGVTPPQKEKDSASQSASDTTSSNENLAPLQTPQLLTKYVNRFNEIQQRLGLAYENLNS